MAHVREFHVAAVALIVIPFAVNLGAMNDAFLAQKSSGFATTVAVSAEDPATTACSIRYQADVQECQYKHPPNSTAREACNQTASESYTDCLAKAEEQQDCGGILGGIAAAQ